MQDGKNEKYIFESLALNIIKTRRTEDYLYERRKIIHGQNPLRKMTKVRGIRGARNGEVGRNLKGISRSKGEMIQRGYW
jgi:hypothetical protein